MGKPGNILVDPQSKAFLTDFGIAASLEELAGQSQQTSGTLAYMSPEQIHGLLPDRRTDIYSLGVVLYELLAGQRPFQADSPAELR